MLENFDLWTEILNVTYSVVIAVHGHFNIYVRLSLLVICSCFYAMAIFLQLQVLLESFYRKCFVQNYVVKKSNLMNSRCLWYVCNSTSYQQKSRRKVIKSVGCARAFERLDFTFLFVKKLGMQMHHFHPHFHRPWYQQYSFHYKNYLLQQDLILIWK